MVSVFFMLSGFFRSLSYWKMIDTPENIPAFSSSLKERFLRIAPAYYVVLVLSLAVTYLIHGSSWIDIPAFISGFFFLSWMSPDTLFPVLLNGPLWFISFDMVGWILTSLVMMGLFRLGRKYMILYFIAIISIVLILHFLWIGLPWPQTERFPANIWFPMYNPFLFFLHFLFGIIAAGIVSVFHQR
jgi:peptidoglycan/LPS O-acetylase OafA/YrhL